MNPFKSLQFPLPEKRKPASYTLTYNDVNVAQATHAPYGICKKEMMRLSLIGWENSRFKIIANY